MIQIQSIDFDNRDKYNQALLDFETLFKYPFGVDHFQIDHGKNYFKFFDFLGEPYFFVATENNEIRAICVAVLKSTNVPNYQKVWYLCDLKVHPDYQGQSIAQKILHYSFTRCSQISKKVYGVSMNADSGFNKMINFAQRFSYLGIKFQQTLEFYLLDREKKEAKKFIESNENKFISLTGIKDLVLESSGKPLRFVHYVGSFQPLATKWDHKMKFMICCSQNSKLSSNFKNQKIYPVTTASVLANFEVNCWDFIKSCDI